MKDKGFWIVMSLFFIMFILDVVSTAINGQLATLLEANPLHPIGGFYLIVGLNIAYMVGLWLWYTRTKSPTIRYYLIAVMVIVIFMRVCVVYTNFMVYQNPPTIEEATAITQQQKQNYYFSTVLTLIIPIIPTFVTYWFWRLDHIIKIKK